MKWITIVFLWLLLLAILCLAGCPSHTVINDPVVGSGNAIAQSQALTESAEKSVVAAKPHADNIGKAHLTSATSDLDQSLAKLDEAQGQLREEQKLRATIAGERDKERAERIALDQSWGHRLQVWVTRLAVLLIGLLVAHFAFGILGLLIPGKAGMILAWLGVLINPASWFQTIRDNYHFRQQAGK